VNKKDIAILARAYECEVYGALMHKPSTMQTKSARVDALVADGLLAPCVEVWRGIRIEGYELTHAGRFAYCETCKDEQENT
jgi:hypothetical protein